MDLPGDSVGITDIIAYRECPRRMSYGMRRHGEAPEHEAAPELAVYGSVWARGYGSAIHRAIEFAEEGYEDEEAVQLTWNEYGRFLDPEDLDLLAKDIALFRARDFPNTRIVASEEDTRVPLFVDDDGRQIYFRFKLDRLYERVDEPGTFIHVDYKSSKWRKSQDEVDSDVQMWAYNWAIHEFWPECDQLIQAYEQLRSGQLITRKDPDQRRQMRDWLVANVKAILADEQRGPDDLLAPSLNEWCPYCPIMESCPVIANITDWTATRIEALAPTEKQGRKLVTLADPSRIEEYTAAFPKVKLAAKILERFEGSVRDLIVKMPSERRAELGFELDTRSATTFTPAAVERLYDQLGPSRFFEAIKVTKTGLEKVLKDDPGTLAWALEQGAKEDGATVVKQT